jgi:Rrf2 family nitric oxide-sensitive transcriptional repressor
MNQILKISEAASLALHTMVYLAEQEGKIVSVKEISEALHRSEFHLSKVLQRLARTGLVFSARGPKGGFRLGASGAETTLMDIFEAIDGPLDSNPCILGGAGCCRTACLLGSFVRRMNEEFAEYMSGKKLLHFMEGLDAGSKGVSSARRGRERRAGASSVRAPAAGRGRRLKK